MLGNIKIRIKNPEHSACVQKKLFEMGARWIGVSRVQHAECTNRPYLYLDNGLISYGTSEDYFVGEASKEVFLVNGEFSDFPEDNQPLVHYREVIVKNPTKPFVPRSRKDAASDRMRELASAIQSYLDRNEYGVPPEWLEEMCELNERLL